MTDRNLCGIGHVALPSSSMIRYSARDQTAGASYRTSRLSYLGLVPFASMPLASRPVRLSYRRDYITRMRSAASRVVSTRHTRNTEGPMTERKMAFSQWWTFNDSTVSYDRDEGAVYEFSDGGGKIVYIGSTNALKRRMREHLSEDAKSSIKLHARHYRYDYRSDYVAEEKRLYNAFLRTNSVKPLCNTIRP